MLNSILIPPDFQTAKKGCNLSWDRDCFWWERINPREKNLEELKLLGG